MFVRCLLGDRLVLGAFTEQTQKEDKTNTKGRHRKSLPKPHRISIDKEAPTCI